MTWKRIGAWVGVSFADSIMALVIFPAEGYDTFIALADADAYLSSVGYADWAAATPERREAALRRGTQYVFNRRILAQYLSPVHGNVLAATCEAAYRDLKGKLYRDVEAQAVTQKTVGPITVQYAQPQNGGQIKIPVIDDLLYGMTYSSGYGPVYFERA
jgi:hypothetical protein